MSSTSSTRPSSRGLRPLTITLTAVAVVYVLSHWVLWTIASRAEETYYLWRKEEWLQVLMPSSHAGRGTRRIMLTGASEAREGFLLEPFQELQADLQPFQGSLSMGTMRTTILMLEYLVRSYGPDAMPRVVVLGITPRFLFNDPAPEHTPIFIALDRYSPFFRIDAASQQLVAKPWLDGWLGRFRFLNKQGRRYRAALKALVLDGVGDVLPSSVRDRFAAELGPSKYHHLPPHSRDFIAKVGAVPWPYDVAAQTDEVRADAKALLALCARHDTKLVVVAMPRGPWMPNGPDDSGFPAYLALAEDAFAGAEIINLSNLLTPDEFHDHTHPVRRGARRVSDIVAGALERDLGE